MLEHESMRNRGVYFNGLGEVEVGILVRKAILVQLVLFEDLSNLKTITRKIDLVKTKDDIWINRDKILDVETGSRYGFLIKKNNQTQFDKKLILDPFALSIDENLHHRKKSTDYLNNLNYSLRNVLVKKPKNKVKQLLSLQNKDLKIVEIHPKSLTFLDKDLDKSQRGKIAGISSKLDFFQSVGINAIELMPINFFDKQENFVNDSGDFLNNYWGYQPLSLLALHNNYFISEKYERQVEELQELVQSSHKKSIAIIMDVVFNHTGESGEFGPVFSYKALAENDYYLRSGKVFYDHTGCGNTFNINSEIGCDLVVRSLEYFVEYFGIDGFRFDLAGSFFYDKNNQLTDKPLILKKISESSILKDTLMIAEPWGIDLNREGWFQKFGWQEWSGNYRNNLRKMVRGDQMIFQKKQILGNDVNKVNFFTCHDGFTLKDLVSYQNKQNLTNGENNRDGTSDNFSANYGIEGETKKLEIKEIRQRQMRNFFSLLYLNFNSIMFQADDLLQHSKNGNNNSFCQDNEISYLNWQDFYENKEKQSFFKFVQKLNLLTNKLKKDQFFYSLKTFVFGNDEVLDHEWLKWLDNHKFTHYYLVANFSNERKIVDLGFGNFQILLDTSGKQIEDFCGEFLINQDKKITLPAYSLILLKKEGAR
jgi:glycogen operon protein